MAVCEQSAECYTCQHFDWEWTLEEEFHPMLETSEWPDSVVCELGSFYPAAIPGWVDAADALMCEDYTEMRAIDQYQMLLSANRSLSGDTA